MLSPLLLCAGSWLAALVTNAALLLYVELYSRNVTCRKTALYSILALVLPCASCVLGMMSGIIAEVARLAERNQILVSAVRLIVVEMGDREHDAVRLAGACRGGESPVLDTAPLAGVALSGSYALRYGGPVFRVEMALHWHGDLSSRLTCCYAWRDRRACLREMCVAASQEDLPRLFVATCIRAGRVGKAPPVVCSGPLEEVALLLPALWALWHLRDTCILRCSQFFQARVLVALMYAQRGGRGAAGG